MIEVVCDASVALKWVLAEDEADVAAARILIAAHRDGRLTALLLDLTLYEVGNVLLRGRGHSAAESDTVVDALAEICPIIAPGPESRRVAARLADAHSLTLYDASYAAVARTRDAPLATADRQLIDAGLGERPGELVSRLGLPAS